MRKVRHLEFLGLRNKGNGTARRNKYISLFELRLHKNIIYEDCKPTKQLSPYVWHNQGPKLTIPDTDTGRLK